LPCDVVLSGADNVCATFGVHHSLTIWKSEKHPKFLRFSTAVNFKCEYLWNGWRIDERTLIGLCPKFL